MDRANHPEGNIADVQHGWDVYGSDEQKVGNVDEVETNYILAHKGIFFPKDLYIPFSAIARIEHDRVYLNVTKDVVDDQGWDMEPTGGMAAGGMAAGGMAAGMTEQTTAGMGAGMAGTGRQAEGRQTLHLHEEQLRVNKERVQAGEVQVGKEVVEEQKTVDVPVTREEVYIERRPGDRRPDDHAIGESAGETIRVPVTEERVNVEKVTVETGEVNVGTRQVQETQQVSDTVRREEARIQAPEGVQVAGAGATGMAGGATTTWAQAMPGFRSSWQQRYGSDGGRWEDVEPSYQYGWQMANDPRYRGRSWSEVQPELQRDWATRYPTTPWDRAGTAIREAWDRVTNRT